MFAQIELQSTLENRFELVRHGTVHLECGPNTIRKGEAVGYYNLFNRTRTLKTKGTMGSTIFRGNRTTLALQ